MKQVETITIQELRAMAERMYGDFVKAVVDLDRGIVVVDAEMHADEEAYLLEHGSRQADLWGINLYPDKFGTDDFIEFDSLINIRPSQDNRSRSVESEQLRTKTRVVVLQVVRP